VGERFLLWRQQRGSVKLTCHPFWACYPPIIDSILYLWSIN